MIARLNIKNYALIEALEFVPSKSGLNIITGETGAGKSIMMGALGLLLGERADTGVLRPSGQKCVVEAHFEVSEIPQVKAFLDSADFDYNNPLIIRREISSTGRSRGFINDTPATLADLKALGNMLVDVHSQHQNHKLNDNDFQYRILDSFANTENLKKEYQEQYAILSKLRKELEELQEKQAELERETDYKNFLFEELQNAELEGLNPTEIESELLKLENADEIQSISYSAYQALEEDEQSLTSQLSQIEAQLSRLSAIDSNIDSVAKSLKSIVLELKEQAADLRGISDSSEVDPKRVDELNDRLHLYRNLVQKHKVLDVEELIALRNKLDDELLQMSSNSDRIDTLERECNEVQISCENLAKSLSEKRYKAQSKLSNTWKQDLEQLGMPNAEVVFQIRDAEKLNSWGKDELQMLFASNKGSKAEPLYKVASGGELSRVMLIIKSYLAKYATLPTMILDEIDTGVSGETARKVAEMMEEIAQNHQLITITHLPQIAAKASRHFYVYKEDEADETHSHVRQLTENERVEEIAKMLSGENPSESARQNALELMQS